MNVHSGQYAKFLRLDTSYILRDMKKAVSTMVNAFEPTRTHIEQLFRVRLPPHSFSLLVLAGNASLRIPVSCVEPWRNRAQVKGTGASEREIQQWTSKATRTLAARTSHQGHQRGRRDHDRFPPEGNRLTRVMTRFLCGRTPASVPDSPIQMRQRKRRENGVALLPPPPPPPPTPNSPLSVAAAAAPPLQTSLRGGGPSRTYWAFP